MYVHQARQQYVRWLRAARDLSPHTIRAYDSDIAAFERQLGASPTIADINRDSLTAFAETQRVAGLSARSIGRRASSLRGFGRWLASRELLPSDPWAGTTIATGRSRTLPRVVPTYDLVRLIRFLRKAADIDSPNGFDQVLAKPHESTTLLAVALMLVTGVRVNELVNIECHAIDLPSGSVRLLGKGRRERHVYLTNSWLEDLTRAYLSTRATLAPSHSRLLFNSRREPLTPSTMRSRLLKATREAGIPTRLTPHMLRHSAATQLIEAGVDIRYIQRLLGHASLTTTEVYTHVSDRALRRVIADADVLRGVLQQR